MLMLGVLLLMMLGGGVVEFCATLMQQPAGRRARACHAARKRCCTSGCASRCGLGVVLLPILGL